MHLIETYALSCGLKIEKPYVFENYTTVPYDKFISFNKVNYPYFPEVIALIRPELEKHGISILQIKANKANLEHDVAILENLQFGQFAYLMKHSLLHFGEDDFLFDLAGYYDIPRVIMFSNTYPSTSKPYWGSPEKERVLSTTGPWAKPSLNSEPTQNFVRFIQPEKIAGAIMELLGIEWKAPYETIYPGNLYRPKHDIIELIPKIDEHVNLLGQAVANIAVRMDYNFDEKFLQLILQQARATIVTNKPVNLDLIRTFRNNIHEILYIIDENGDPDFARELGRLNLQHAAISYLPTDKLQPLIEKFFEVCVINQLNVPTLKDVKELAGGLQGLSYKSSKRIFEGAKESKSRFEYLSGINSKHTDLSLCPEQENYEFMRELEFMFIVKPT